MSLVSDSSSIAAELQNEGFAIDTNRPATQSQVRGEQVTRVYYKHADGRGALLLQTATRELGGAIYDSTGKVIERFDVSHSGSAQVMELGGGCTGSWTSPENDYSFLVWSSTCDGENGTLCATACFFDGTCESDAACTNVACACAAPYAY
ncbi:MAG TPA: hypothetical protein VGH28_06025 [Polyangiaceae bacterium]